ncbi:MAG TPA: HAMP domain-containing sensor histidine kinase [Candidatus Acidoferrales bacterium]|nr:HAMP domain-containing sensor histidine kinase [Candidatus Acidoferrales bacterium]
MQIKARRTKMVFFLILGICLVAAAVALTGSWIILNWRERVLLFFGLVFFFAIIGGLILNTVFLVREIRRNEHHDSFINAVTHELKTPITSIRLYLETLQRREVDEKQRQQFYRLMLEDTDRLRGTVEQVLKAGEVGYKRPARNSTQVDFGDLVRESMELARTRHHLQPAALHWQEPAGVNGLKIQVQGDPDELRTAILNILDNAIKYSGAKVDVSVGIETPDDHRVMLHVHDEGIGIPAHELKRIFKRFYRVRGRSVSQVKGTGLGLFIVRAIARAHGGRVFAESEGETRGTTITLELPRIES